jgi:hypothetical protein
LNAWTAISNDLFELDSERVLVLCERRGRGKTSGRELGQLGSERASLFHVRRGKVIRFIT